ncbi:MBOAT family O-acyltransferase [Flavobacterium urocaniciphilum]|uniref:D-alanyl-lipoteichoic acid acyltransferase DltB, MBOAT superfamily n=1 Tax=Flavobacterium urocaniciphilum TaxID=1299341 RepID=A0A1H9B179_9FLAO|nr:MBOAT family O-acyltransferase [Flavobacterium urocaniciphilum]SEP82629.1 D-alanyl-lipoteichoic acid acyltransferase DltB, MBOAT superfamily [Flavobacterium urocaniciphilum]
MLQDWFSKNIGVITPEIIKSWFVYDKDAPLLFNTGLFLGLFLVFYFWYILLRKANTLRMVYVILFSLFFYYKSSGIYFLLLLGSAVVDYNLGNLVHRTSSIINKRLCLTFSIILNLGFLGYFKYSNFIVDITNNLTGGKMAFFDVILPVGISFYTFQSISYIIEIYRKEIEPTKRFVDYLFFVSFFPQLVAGPIVRAKDFLPQIYQKLNVTQDDINRAFLLIIGGLIKKTIISDYISINFVDRVFDLPNAYTPFENLMASYGYTIQIYCDFSGYSDMAIGVALLLGFKLPTNFLTPYKSASITEFWRRWHISLSTWLKDFLYISVGGNRHGTFAGFLFPGLFFVGLIIWGISFSATSNIPLIIAVSSAILFALTFLLSKDRERTMYTNVNLMTTMLLGGLWHGASLRFIIWGALHGLALAVHKIFLEHYPPVKRKITFFTPFLKTFSIVVTFHFVAFCWIFFRAKDFPTALQVIENIGKVTFDFNQWLIIAQGYKNVFILMFLGYFWHYIPQKVIVAIQNVFISMPLITKAIVLGLIFWLVFATASAGPQPFIYFQF